MKNIISKKLLGVSLAVALVSGASIVTANAAIDLGVSIPLAAAPAESAVVPASDFTATGSFSPKVVMNPTVVIPEPGTMIAGFAVLTYLLFSTGRTGRRSRA